MSQRPRLGGDGRLRLPVAVEVRESGDIVGTLGDASYEPFERVASDLLLPEEFARAQLGPEAPGVADWYRRHGVLDLQHYFPEDDLDLETRQVASPAFHDATELVLRQQTNVRWHLETLARLSDHLYLGHPDVGAAAGSGSWQARWARPVIDGLVPIWIGGATMASLPILPEVWGGGPSRDFADREAPREGRDPFLVEISELALRRIRQESIPALWVPRAQRDTVFRLDADMGLFQPPPTDLPPEADWWGLVRLQRTLLEPYILRASQHEVRIRSAGHESEEAVLDARAPRGRGPLTVRLVHSWISLLAPVYLQLLEALRRISEGRRGATFCKECARPFLTLDARRSSFCTDRERFRFAQRARRRRVQVHDSAVGSDSATVTKEESTPSGTIIRIERYGDS